MLNRVNIMGRLGKDPELKSTQSGVSVTSFSVAVDRDYSGQNGQKETDWFDIVAWRQTAEFICKYFGKGSVIAIDGRLQARKWKDKDGNNRISVEIIAVHAYFAGAKRDGEATGAASGYSIPPAPAGFDEIDDYDDGDCPF